MTHRNTIQRELVLETVQKLRNHATADEIYAALTKEYPSISRGTVYRNLNRLAETDKIRKISIPGSADRFDHRCVEHYHVRCMECDRVFDVDMDCFPEIENNIRDTHGFLFTGVDIIFSGVCPKCRK